MLINMHYFHWLIPWIRL